MKTFNLFALSAFALTAASAHADIIRCTFTEPFLSTEYSMAQQSLSILSPGEDGKGVRQTIRGVSLQIVGPTAKKPGPARFELRDAKGKILQKLILNHDGSDGMSDFEYPYEAEYRGLTGGCYSNALPRTGSDS